MIAFATCKEGDPSPNIQPCHLVEDFQPLTKEITMRLPAPDKGNHKENGLPAPDKGNHNETSNP